MFDTVAYWYQDIKVYFLSRALHLQDLHKPIMWRPILILPFSYPQGMNVQEPQMLQLSDNSNPTLVRQLKTLITQDRKLAVSVFSAKQGDRYRLGHDRRT